MAAGECAICGGDLIEHEVEEEREERIRGRSPEIEEDEEIHAFVCEDCGHVVFHRPGNG
ncbi:MAG: YgiT-type zinc finger protein [Candidatus Nanohaloarchaea archaeon]|nr:YgiT-type zinc finger protein [Candidatus Nanohaloarchaea archaeon]